jgi:hypothetical protein
MKHIAALCLMTCLPGIALSQDASTAEAGWAKMQKCATIAEDKARHACTDQTLREAGLLTEATQRKAFGLQKPEPAPAAEGSSPKNKNKNENLEVTLAKVEQAGDGKLVLTTTDGAVWRQVESVTVRPMPAQGGAMTIESRSLGGFMCEPSKYVSFRCYRSR